MRFNNFSIHHFCDTVCWPKSRKSYVHPTIITLQALCSVRPFHLPTFSSDRKAQRSLYQRIWAQEHQANKSDNEVNCLPASMVRWSSGTFWLRRWDVIWYIEVDDEWVKKLDDSQVNMFESAVSMGVPEFEYFFPLGVEDSHKYKIDFVNMQQTNLHTNKVRSLWRMQLPSCPQATSPFAINFTTAQASYRRQDTFPVPNIRPIQNVPEFQFQESLDFEIVNCGIQLR